jgi:Sulfotransferase domain
VTVQIPATDQPKKSLPRRLRRRVSSAVRASTWYLRTMPDFIVIGAQKSGSTSLYWNLCEHPHVMSAKKKEIHYFDIRSGRGLWWYRANFPSSLAKAARRLRQGPPISAGEASPYYLYHPKVPQRIGKVLPDVRLIAILRDPVERAISHYHMSHRRGHDLRPIEEALLPDESEPVDAVTFDEHGGPHQRLSYLGRGRYAEQLERWFAVFPREQLMILETASYSRSGGEGFARVLEYIGMPPWDPPALAEYNVAKYPVAEQSVVEELTRYYAPHNEHLWDLLGVRWDWRAP